MIEIHCAQHKITITGHAGYAEPGKDIVCAGVSALVQTLIQSIETLTQDTIKCTLSPGAAEINLGDLSERASVLVDSFFVGCTLMAGEYPDRVRVYGLPRPWDGIKSYEMTAQAWNA